MWVVVFIGLAALTWLIELTSGPDGMAAMGASALWFDRTALAFATLGGAQLLLVFLRQLVRRDGASGGSVRTDLLQALLVGLELRRQVGGLATCSPAYRSNSSTGCGSATSCAAERLAAR